jgi:predicted nucleic acid-binding Zn ribbon protein
MSALETTSHGSPHGVATPSSSLLDSGPRCLQCGKVIPRPRPGQKACSAKCRWALWTAARRAEQDADRAALLLMRSMLDDLLARHDARRAMQPRPR